MVQKCVKGASPKQYCIVVCNKKKNKHQCKLVPNIIYIDLKRNKMYFLYWPENTSRYLVFNSKNNDQIKYPHFLVMK